MDLTSKSNTPPAQTADTEEVEGATAPSTSSVYSVKSLPPRLSLQNWKIFLCCIVCIYVELPPCTSVLIASEHGNHLQ